jgi:hypothetical protein
MAQSKEKAQENYEQAREAAEQAQNALRVARTELDEFLREEEAERQAVYLGYEPGDEEGIRAAKAIMERRRETKAAVKAEAADGPIGGVS